MIDHAFATVIVPVKNAATTLDVQLEALARQTCAERLEVLVVDNGSTDGSREEAAAWRDRLPGLRVLTCPAPGANAARNAGIDEATAPWLLFCDADDRVRPDWAEQLVAAAERLGADAVAGDLDDDELNDPAVFAFRQRNPPGLSRVARFLPRGITANLAVRASVARGFRFNEQYQYGATDTDFCWRLQLAGYLLGHAPAAVVAYRHRAGTAGIVRKAYLTGIARTRLFRDFRAAGMPRSNPAGAAARWLLLLVKLPFLLTDRAARLRWARDVAGAAGRVRGSIKHRTLYL